MEPLGAVKKDNMSENQTTRIPRQPVLTKMMMKR